MGNTAIEVAHRKRQILMGKRSSPAVTRSDSIAKKGLKRKQPQAAKVQGTFRLTLKNWKQLTVIRQDGLFHPFVCLKTYLGGVNSVTSSKIRCQFCKFLFSQDCPKLWAAAKLVEKTKTEMPSDYIGHGDDKYAKWQEIEEAREIYKKMKSKKHKSFPNIPSTIAQIKCERCRVNLCAAHYNDFHEYNLPCEKSNE